jgi:hypothetical protein
MSAYRIAGSDALAALRAHLAMHHTVMQPLPDSDGNLHWQEADSAAPLPAQIALPAFSPKALLFAERESLFSFDGPCLPRNAGGATGARLVRRQRLRPCRHPLSGPFLFR